MSETKQPLKDAPTAATATRTVLAKGERVPWPRRLIATGLLAAVLALTLHALPRPYQTIPTGVVRGLGDAYGSLRSSYRNEVAALEPVAGEASAEERKAYARELWRYRWLGSFREILLRFSEWLAASCMLVALSMIAVERRRAKRAFAARGAKTDPTMLRHETLAGEDLGTKEPGVPDEGPRGAVEATPPFPMSPRIPLRETGDEVTPPSPTPVPKIGALDLRPAQFDDDDDLGRTTEGQAPNLAKLPVTVKPSVIGAEERAAALPVFFAERRHVEPHPVVHPGDPPPPAEPMPTPAPGPSPLPFSTNDAPSPSLAAKSDATPAAAIDDDSLPVWLKGPPRRT